MSAIFSNFLLPEIINITEFETLIIIKMDIVESLELLLQIYSTLHCEYVICLSMS